MFKSAKEFFSGLNSSAVFFSALLCLPGIMFQQSLLCIWLDLMIFAVLVGLKKGRLRILPPLAVCLSIVFFNLFKADGFVLFSIFSFKVTSFALQDGLRKSGVLLAMVFVSQYAVSRDLHLPGKTGGFLGSVFCYFDALNGENISPPVSGFSPASDSVPVTPKRKKTFNPRTLISESVSALIEKTDEKLLHVFFSQEKPPAVSQYTAGDEKFVLKKSASVVRLFFSVLPLFPVYLLLILSGLGIFPV